MNKIAKSSEIKIKVGLDEQNVPVRIDWQADDNPAGHSAQECKAMLLSFFDKKSKETFKIDLWTNDMQLAEMDRFFYHTLRALANTYFKATQNSSLASDLQQFVQHFGEKTKIIPKD